MEQPAKRKRGRPPLNPGEGAKRSPLNFRTTVGLRKKIEQASQESGLSMTQEVERRLILSFVTQEQDDKYQKILDLLLELRDGPAIQLDKEVA